MPDNDSSHRGRRSVLKGIGALGAAAGFAGVSSATPGRGGGPKEAEILVGVSATAADVGSTVANDVPGNAEVVHTNDTLRYVAVKFPSTAADEARENFVEAVTKQEHIKYAEANATHEALATPVVSGVAGLTLAQWSSLSNSDLRSHLKSTAEDIGLSGDEQGSGQVDAAAAISTEPGSGGGGGGDDGGSGDSTSASVSGSLSGYWDDDDYSYGWNYSDPSQVVIELDGPADADFDLYVNTGTTANATPSDYDYGSYTADSQETIVIDAPDDSTELQIDVDSYSGSGSYTVTVTEYE